jgi:hypothetical protein
VVDGRVLFSNFVSAVLADPIVPFKNQNPIIGIIEEVLFFVDGECGCDFLFDERDITRLDYCINSSIAHGVADDNITFAFKILQYFGDMGEALPFYPFSSLLPINLLILICIFPIIAQKTHFVYHWTFGKFGGYK